MTDPQCDGKRCHRVTLCFAGARIFEWWEKHPCWTENKGMKMWDVSLQLHTVGTFKTITIMVQTAAPSLASLLRDEICPPCLILTSGIIHRHVSCNN